MLNENTRQNLRTLLEEEMKALRAAREARALLDGQIQEHQEKITAIQKVLGEDIPGDLWHEENEHVGMTVKPPHAREGTVTDEIRRLFEAKPHIKAEEVISRVRSKFKNSRIGPQSFSTWDSYFKHGRYQMDGEKYRIRYGKETPY